MKPIEEQNFYELLDLPPDAPNDAVEQAYARAMQHYGPESVAVYALADPDQVKLMVERIEEAYLTLTDRALRQDYDARTFGQKAAEPPPVAPAPEQAAAVVAVVDDNGQLGFGLMSPQKVFAWPGSRPGAEDEEPAVEKSPEAKEAEAEVLRAFAPDLAPAEAAPEPPPEVPKAPPPEPVAEAVVPAAQPVGAAEAASLAVADLPPHPSDPPAQAELALASASAAALVAADLPPHPPAPLTAEVAVETASAAALAVPPLAPHPAAAVEAAPPAVVEVAPPAAELPEAPVAPKAEVAEPKAADVVPPPLPVKAIVAPAKVEEPVKAEAPAAKEPPREEPKPAAKPLPRMPEITEATVFNGEFLRRVREARGLTLRELAEKTRISYGHLDNIEADRYDPLPVGVYLRGFLMSVARELKLDPLRVSKAYGELVAAHKGKKAS